VVTVADGPSEGKGGRTDGDGQEQRKSVFGIKNELVSRIYHSPTTPKGRHVLHVLVFHYNARTGQCNPSQETIARETGYSERTVRNVIRQDLANLVTSRRSQRGLYYTLHLPEQAPPMLVNSPAPGQYAVAHVESNPDRNPSAGRKLSREQSRPEPVCRSDRNPSAGRTGTRLPVNRERTEKERFFKAEQQKSSSSKKGKTVKPTLDRLKTAFEARGFPADKARAEAERFTRYNEEKGWCGDWEQNVERWQPQEWQTETEFKPAYHRPYKPEAVEVHTSEERQRSLDILRNLSVQLARKVKP